MNFKIEDEKAPRLPDIKEMLQKIINIRDFFKQWLIQLKKSVKIMIVI